MKPLRGCETLEADRIAGVGIREYKRGYPMLLTPKGKEPHESGDGAICLATAFLLNVDLVGRTRLRIVGVSRGLRLSLIHISEPTRRS